MAGLNSDMAQTSELSDQEFKRSMIYILRELLKKLNNIQEQMGDVSRETEVLRKNRKGTLHIKNTVTDMKNTFNKLSDRLNRVKERISKLEDVSIETSETEIQKGKIVKRHNRVSKTCGSIRKIGNAKH